MCLAQYSAPRLQQYNGDKTLGYRCGNHFSAKGPLGIDDIIHGMDLLSRYSISSPASGCLGRARPDGFEGLNEAQGLDVLGSCC